MSAATATTSIRRAVVRVVVRVVVPLVVASVLPLATACDPLDGGVRPPRPARPADHGSVVVRDASDPARVTVTVRHDNGSRTVYTLVHPLSCALGSLYPECDR